MKRRRWPDVVIVIAILALGAGGVWTLWGDELAGESERRETAPTAPGAAPTM